jgi:hypothetical protein
MAYTPTWVQQKWFLKKITKMIKEGVCHNVAVPFTLKSILRKKKNYGNSNTYLTMPK